MSILPIVTLLAALVSGFFPSHAEAHAVVTDTTLHIEPIQVGKPKQISLSFNSQVEIKLSTFDLVKKGDIREPLNIQAGPKRGQVLVDLPALEAGEHAIQLKVFAADGHLTEDLVRFFVVE